MESIFSKKETFITLIIVILILAVVIIVLGLLAGGVFNRKEQSTSSRENNSSEFSNASSLITSSSSTSSSQISSSSNIVPTSCYSTGLDRSIFAVAGSPTTTSGYLGDGGLAVSASINPTGGIAFDENLCILYFFQNPGTIRAVNMQTGIITTIVGNGTSGTTLVPNNPLLTRLSTVVDGLFVDPEDSSLFICDTGNHRILRYFPGPTVPTIELWAGTGVSGRTEGTRLVVRFISPNAITKDRMGNYYISDSGSPGVVYKLDPTTNICSYFIGMNGSGPYITTTPEPGLSLRLGGPRTVRYDPSTNILYFQDSLDQPITNLSICVADLASITTSTSLLFTQFRTFGFAIRPDSNQLWISALNRIVSIPKLIVSNIVANVVGEEDRDLNTGDGAPISGTTFVSNPNACIFDSTGNFYFISINPRPMVRRITTLGL